MISVKRLVSRATSIAVVATVTLSTASAQTVPKCRPADGQSAALIYELKRYVTSQDPKVINARDNYYHIPVVATSQISLVTDERLCQKAIQAYASFASGAYTPTQVYLIKLGTKNYVAHDPSVKAGEFSIVHVFDAKFILIGGWVGG